MITGFREYADHQYRAAEQEQDMVAMTIWARAAQKARRLALIYACSADYENLRITAEAVRWATQFVGHQTRRMLFMASAHVAENPFHAECLKVMEKLREAPACELNHSTLLKRMKMRAKDFRELIETMHERGDIGIRRVPTTGRTGTYYYLAGNEKGREQGGET